MRIIPHWQIFRYDENGRMTDQWDRDGYHTAYSYDRRGLLKDILYADGTSVAYSYDALRRLEEVKDSIGTTQIVTDALGRVLSVTDPRGKTVGYEWGSMNEKQRLVYPDGKEASYNYNEKGQLEALTTPGGTIRYTYDTMGRLKEKAFPNGITTEYSYNSMGHLETINHSGNGLEEEYSYQYDMAGNKIRACKQRQGMDADSGSFQYGYDALNRLTEVSRDGSLLRRYAYDAFGNRTVKEDYRGQTAVQTTYRYNANNQMISRISDEEEQTYTYDYRGNLTAVSRGEEQFKTFTFDAANRMHSAFEIKDGIGTRAEYTYNAFGNRTGQDIYSVEPDNSIPETAGQKPQNPERQVYYTLDLTRQYHNLLASEDKAEQKEQTFYWDGNVAAMEEDERDSYYLQDDLGSPMQLMGEEGEIRETYGFDEFGRNLDQRPEKQIQPFGYTGYQMEAAGGLYFAQARRYDANNGRFISEDKISGSIVRPISLNRYGYCWNNPLVLVDLDGYKPKKIKGEDSEDENTYSTEINYDTPTVTFCVDAPEEGSRNAINDNLDVGHTFIIIDYGNGTTYSRGFYPQNPLSTDEIISKIDVTGEVRDDATHGYNESITYQITEEQANQLLEFANNYDQNYNMVNNNCTTFAVEALQSIGIDVPTTEHTWTLPDNIDEIAGVPKFILYFLGAYNLKGYSPGDAAMDIREYKENCEAD